MSKPTPIHSGACRALARARLQQHEPPSIEDAWLNYRSACVPADTADHLVRDLRTAWWSAINWAVSVLPVADMEGDVILAHEAAAARAIEDQLDSEFPLAPEAGP